MVLSGLKWNPRSEDQGSYSRCQRGPPPSLSMPSRRPLARPWGLCHPESSHTHLDWVRPRLWQPVFGKLGEGGLGRG